MQLLKIMLEIYLQRHRTIFAWIILIRIGHKTSVAHLWMR